MTVLANMTPAQRAEFLAAGDTSGLLTKDQAASGTGVAASTFAGQAAAQVARLTRGFKLATVGDSVLAGAVLTAPDPTGYAYSITSTSVARRASSPMAWLQFLSGQQFDFDRSRSFNVASSKSPDAITQYDQNLANVDFDALVVHTGTNDIVNGITGDQTFANILALYDRAHDRGIQFWQWGIPPRANGSWTDSPNGTEQLRRQQNIKRANDLCRAASKIYPGWVFADTEAYVGAQNGQPVTTSVAADGLHPSAQEGGYWWGRAMWDALLAAGFRYYPRRRNQGLPNAYDVTWNPSGNRLLTPQLNDAAGIPGTGATGTIPSNWTLSRQTGAAMSALGSQVARPDGLRGNCQQNVFSTTASSGNGFFRFQHASTVVPVGGETWDASMGVDISGAVGLRGILQRMQFLDAGNAVLFDAHCFESVSSGYLPSALTGVAATDPVVVPAGATQARFWVDVYLDLATPSNTATVKLFDAQMGRVA